MRLYSSMHMPYGAQHERMASFPLSFFQRSDAE
jgi:hypothetical protein